MILTFESVDETLKWATQIKATELYFPVVVLLMLYKVILTSYSVYEILKCDY